LATKAAKDIYGIHPFLNKRDKICRPVESQFRTKRQLVSSAETELYPITKLNLSPWNCFTKYNKDNIVESKILESFNWFPKH